MRYTASQAVHGTLPEKSLDFIFTTDYIILSQIGSFHPHNTLLQEFLGQYVVNEVVSDFFSAEMVLYTYSH